MSLETTTDINIAAVCGLFCGACSVFIATQEDPVRLAAIAQKLNQTVEETACNGCRSDNVSGHCSHCAFRECASQKGILFCSECSEFPCKELVDFQAKMPHRIELWESLDLIKKEGLESWHKKMITDYSCKSCHTINSAYDFSCRSCGSTPGNDYISRNEEQIKNSQGIKLPPKATSLLDC